MTFLEKFKRDHPTAPSPDNNVHGICPCELGYEEAPDDCSSRGCSECWGREIPETQTATNNKEKDMAETKRCETCGHCFEINGIKTCTADEICDSSYSAWDPRERGADKRQELATDTIEEKFTIATPIIKDSGDRTEFKTGAVRDMREGKGRCDLMPLDVVGKIYSYFLGGDDDIPIVFFELEEFKNTGDPNHLVKALNRSHVFGESCSTMFLETAIHFEEGAKKYGPNNWQKGIDVNCYIDSAVRHYLKWLRGDNDERHDRAFCWNLMCAIWTCEHKPELNTYSKENT